MLSLPYHNPLWVADRAILLDHLTRGRFMLGLGPGALPTDAAMIGIDPAEQRPALEEDVDVLMHLLLSDEPVTKKTERYSLRRRALPAAPVHRPVLRDRHRGDRVAVGPADRRQARRWACCRSAPRWSATSTCWPCTGTSWRNGRPSSARPPTATSGAWSARCTSPRPGSRRSRDVEYGIEAWFDYLQHTAAAPQFHPLGDTLEERIAWVNESGVGVIGTPEDAVSKIDELYKQSNGGFGCYLMMAHEWARPEADTRHYELFAQHVMPEVPGLGRPPAGRRTLRAGQVGGPQHPAGQRAHGMDREARRGAGQRLGRVP